MKSKTAWLMIIAGAAVGIPAIMAIGGLSGGTLNHVGPPMEWLMIALLGISILLLFVGLMKLSA